MKRHVFRKTRGFTLTELLVVMVIIGLLSTIIVPVYVSRMEDARVRIARAECREIAQAEEQCAIIHGYYLPFQLLDDLPDPPKGTSPQSADEIGQYPWPDQTYIINPLVNPRDQIPTGKQRTLGDANTYTRIKAMLEHWEGPFLTPHRVYDIPTGLDPKDPNYEAPANRSEAQLDFPLDPWGAPYRFYSPLGVIGTNALDEPSSTYGYGYSFSDGRLTTRDDRHLPRYAVVSYGRDNLPEYNQASKDDIVHLFGTPGVESEFGMRF